MVHFRIAAIQALEARRLLTVAYTATPLSGTPLEIAAVIQADLDRDGDIDLIVASEGDDRISWYENEDGQGNFGERRIVTSLARGVRAVVAADIDGDGHLDLLSGSFNDDKIVWYRNEDGLGNFGSQQTIADQAKGIEQTFAVDVDGDRDLDVVAVNGEGHVTWYENLGNAMAFSGPSQIASALGNVRNSVFVDDFDGDNHPDVLIAAAGVTFMNDGSGQFVERQHESMAKTGQKAFAIGDMDGDVDLDVLVSSDDFGTVWLENQAGNFESQHVISTIRRTLELAVVDIDGDEDMDVIATDRAFWFENLPDGTFNRVTATGIAQQPVLMLPCRIDEDHLPDIAVVTSDDEILWFRNGGQFAFEAMMPVDGPNWQDEFVVNQMYDADLDGDQDLDLVILVSKPDTLLGWYENVDGHLVPGKLKTISESVLANTSPQPVDFDFDGDLDFVFPNVWYENDGKGAFTERPETDLKIQPIAVRDIDGDGADDILSFSRRGSISWVKNLGGRFGEEQTIAVDSSVWLMDAADLDGDGDTDIVAAFVQGDGRIAWYENTDGRGHFSSEKVIASDFTSALHVSIADVDKDGAPDVVAWIRRNSFGRIVWYKNQDGRGSFDSSAVSELAGDAYALADFDQDDDLDFIVGSASGVQLMENRSGASDFARSREIGSPRTAFLLATDLNHDGVPAFVAGGNRDGVTVLEPYFVDIVATDDSFVTTTNTTLTVAAPGTLGNDSHSSVSAIIEREPQSGNLRIKSDGSFVYEPDPGFTGTDTFTYRSRTTSGVPSNPATVTIVVSSPTPNPGDANSDGNVTFADFLILSNNFGSIDAVFADGDFDGDGRVTLDDFLILAGHYG